jgi:hypothetical protein
MLNHSLKLLRNKLYVLNLNHFREQEKMDSFCKARIKLVPNLEHTADPIPVPSFSTVSWSP